MSDLASKKVKLAHYYYGQLVIGPPGSGKTTYCWKMSELLRKEHRNVIVVNLDPANDCMTYKPDVDIRHLIKLDEVMKEFNLGPNGGLVYCMEYLEKNIDWLLTKISGNHGTNVIFDLPGQVELYSHHNSLSNIFHRLVSENMHLCVVHLVDSHHCSDAGKFISALMLSLSAMLRSGLPHINVLTKVDLLKKNIDKLQFGIDFYTDVLDLNYLLESLDEDAFTSKYKKLNSAMISIIEDYSLVSFQLVDAFKEESLAKVKNSVDRACGFVFKSDKETNINSMLSCALGMGDIHKSDLD